MRQRYLLARNEQAKAQAQGQRLFAGGWRGQSRRGRVRTGWAWAALACMPGCAAWRWLAPPGWATKNVDW